MILKKGVKLLGRRSLSQSGCAPRLNGSRQETVRIIGPEMKKPVLFLWVAITPLAANDLYLSCSVHSIEHSRAVLGKRAGTLNRLWTCGIHNGGTVERVVTEADMLMGLHALGVPAIQAIAVQQVFERARYTGRMYTTARVLEHVAEIGVLGAALDVIKLGSYGRALIGLGAAILPRLPPALRARSPSGIELEMLRIREPLGVKPDAGVQMSIWSGPYDGPLIVRGYLRDLVMPIGAQ